MPKLPESISNLLWADPSKIVPYKSIPDNVPYTQVRRLPPTLPRSLPPVEAIITLDARRLLIYWPALQIVRFRSARAPACSTPKSEMRTSSSALSHFPPSPSPPHSSFNTTRC